MGFYLHFQYFLFVIVMLAGSLTACVAPNIIASNTSTKTPHAPHISPQIYIIGTAHGKHLSGHYPLQTFDTLFQTHKPDLVLLEISNEDLSRNQWLWAPPEMAYIFHLAQQHQIRVYGIDASINIKSPSPNPPQFQALANKATQHNLQETLKIAAKNFSFANLNNDDMLNTLSTLQTQGLFQDTERKLRDQKISENILYFINKSSAKTIFIFTGFKHRYTLTQALKSHFQLMSPLFLYQDSDKQNLLQNHTTAPAAVRKIWENSLMQLEKRSQNIKDSPQKAALRRKSELFLLFLNPPRSNI